ncbi:cell division cycle protein 91 [Coprinellus micaceus]|uniref:Cell division cycle protein 91 n=1 Tax=Coprinellus micaceus TaxID=71717 RepID=A0A4Y7TWZ0_COPMI|nr:cell division cycle protein 91 [Coprinellus micaceus]
MSSTLLQVGVVIPALTALRLGAHLAGASELLLHDQQLTTPLTSYSQLQEGLYLFNHGIDPYNGGTVRHSPLLLALFSSILPSSRDVAATLWALCDAIAAWALVQTWRARQNVSSSSRDGLVAAMYLLNPYIFLPTLALSTSSLENALLLLAVMFASQKKAAASLLSLAFLSHLSPNALLLLPPLVLILLTNPHSHLASPQKISFNAKKVAPLAAEFLLYTGVLTAASTLVAGSWRWIPQTWGTWFTLPDLTPNVGLWWYFFTEMFDHFRSFFLVVFSIHLLIYVAPLCIKFQHDPLYALFLLTGIIGAFKSYPTLADPGLFLSMTSIFPETFPYLRFPIVTSLLHLHSALLLPLFHHLWLTQGTGNANFYYASTLVFACSNGAAILDALWAGMRIAIGKDVDGYAVDQE